MTNFVLEVIEQVSYKGAGVDNKATSTEGLVVQDADRLGSIGVIGVVRICLWWCEKKIIINTPLLNIYNI